MLTRRDYLIGTGAALALAPIRVLAEEPVRDSRNEGPFSWDILKDRAHELARQPWREPPMPSARLETVDFDMVNRIHYRADRTLWPAHGGGIRFFPVNRFARTPIRMSIVENGRALAFPYSQDLFETPAHLPSIIEGFAGFRVITPNGRSDWLAYQGSSYFRSSGALDQYGLSARGLAIDTGLGKPEEFPIFSHFWLEQGPGPATTVYALLESPSATGTYRFVNRKTAAGVVQDVTLSVDLRKDVQRIGFAPLTSMFWYGEGNRKQAIDWRPEIHDSDGLALLTGAGERIWRPLVNPPQPATNSFMDTDPRGFGLLQRDRFFDHYQDDGVFYEKRPNLWIEPIGKWGKGAVTLYEIPTRREYEDNIVAFWVPDGAAKAGNHYDLRYRLHWTGTEPQPIDVARTNNIWSGTAGAPAADPIPGAERLVADFYGQRLHGLTRESAVEAVVSVSAGSILHKVAYPVAGTQDTWRLVVDISRENGAVVDLRAYLRQGHRALTETLIYQIHAT